MFSIKDDLEWLRQRKPTEIAQAIQTNQARNNSWPSYGESEREHKPRCSNCQGAGWFLYDVDIHHALFGKPQRCSCMHERDRALRVERLQQSIGSQLGNGTFANFNRDANPKILVPAVAMCRVYAEAPSGWLYIWSSEVGTGKSHLATAILRERDDTDMLFIKSTTLLSYLRDGGENKDWGKRTDHIKQVRLLVLDDLGVEKHNNWTLGKMYEILDERYIQQRPTIITSNLPIAGLFAKADAIDRNRLISRIAGIVGDQVVCLNGVTDYRRRKP